jgi:DNA ligase-1
MKRRHLLLAWGTMALPLTAAAEPAPSAPPALQLAGQWRPSLDVRAYWVSEKYDGVRGYWDGHQLRTRGGETVNAPAWFTAGWPAEAMDGELWAGRGTFEHVQSTVLRQQPDDSAWRRLRFMVFDWPAHPGDFDARLAALNSRIAQAGRPTLHAVPQRRVANDAQLHALLREVVQGGGEGLMLRRGDSLYRAGRGDDLLKLKEHDDAEAQVIAHIAGQGKYHGQLGALLVQTPSGQRFRLGSGFSDAQRADPPPIGSWVTYRYRGVHARSGLPRFATFLRVRVDEPKYRTSR